MHHHPSSPNFRTLANRSSGWWMGAALLSLITTAHSAISLNGTAVQNAKDTTGTVNVASGSLGLLIIDVAGDGIVGLPNGTSGALDATDNPGVTYGNAGLNTGNYFGGDLVVARLTAAGAGAFGGAFSISLPSFNIQPYYARSFAIVWFDQIQTASSPATAPEGTTFGVVRGSDWILPGGDGGSYTFSGTDASGPASYYSVQLTNNPAAAIGFRTTNGSGASAASFTVVPEPSSALIAGCGIALPILLGRKRTFATQSKPT